MKVIPINLSINLPIFELTKFHFPDTSQLLLRLRETQSKHQEEMSQKRATIDHLSTQMASLASHHKELRAKNNQLCDSARILAESLSGALGIICPQLPIVCNMSYDCLDMTCLEIVDC